MEVQRNTDGETPSNREADLRLCFRICKKPIFSRRGSNIFKCTFTLEGDLCVQHYGQKTYSNTKTKPRSKIPILYSGKANRFVNQVSQASSVIQHRSRLRIFVYVGGTYQIERNKTLVFSKLQQDCLYIKEYEYESCKFKTFSRCDLLKENNGF